MLLGYVKCVVWLDVVGVAVSDTTTRGAHQADEKDNRSRGLFHLMTLLQNMRLCMCLWHIVGYIMWHTVVTFTPL